MLHVLKKMLFILLDHKKVCEYPLNNSESELNKVRELMNKEIISLSGTWHHVLAVSSKNENIWIIISKLFSIN